MIYPIAALPSGQMATHTAVPIIFTNEIGTKYFHDDHTFRHMRELPAAEEQRRDDRADDEQVSPFRHEEEQVAHPAILSRETRHQFRLGFGQIERCPVTLGQRGYIE